MLQIEVFVYMHTINRRLKYANYDGKGLLNTNNVVAVLAIVVKELARGNGNVVRSRYGGGKVAVWAAVKVVDMGGGQVWHGRRSGRGWAAVRSGS
jgi:uncharacterized protein YqgC (DUF456 family)